jgi:biopolymer transport protein ExbD
MAAGFSQREARTLIRRAIGRVPEGESIRHLNIMPMMDMMTILLVAFIFQMATSSLELVAASTPRTVADAPLPEQTWMLVITQTGIVVEGSSSDTAKTVVPVINGDVDPADKEGGLQGMQIPKLTSYLTSLRAIEVDTMRKKGQDPSKAPAPEMLLIADRMTSYRLLIEVMLSASKGPGYKHFRMIVQKNFPTHPSK